jgi:hypothetical protein
MSSALGELAWAATLAHHLHYRHLSGMLDYWMNAWDFHIWAVVAVGSAIVAVISSVADRRRQRRKFLNNVGFMPWTAISLFSIGLTLISTALAIKAG